MRLLKLILTCCSLLLISAALAQTDTSFWFAAPQIQAFSYQGVTMNQPIVLNINSYDQPATVTISQPAGGGMPTQTVFIPANSTRSVDLTNWLNLIECKPGNTVLNYGLYIHASDKISVYYEINANGFNPDLFSLKGRNALGNEFWISSQNYLDNTSGSYSSFNIIATENNTLVTIIPSNNIVGHLANTPFTINLNKGQTYAAIDESPTAALHLQGSHVISNHPIAITLSDDELEGTPYGGCKDLAGDQTVPVNILGTEYIAVRGELNAPFDKVYVMATQNSTTLEQDGTMITTLNAGQTYECALTNTSTYIKCSNPVYAYQLSGIGCEAGSAILPKISCTGSTSLTFTKTSNESLYITLLVMAGGQGNFLVNNSSGFITAGMFSPVPGTSNQWYAAKVPLNTPAGSVIKVHNTTNLFNMGVLQGGTVSGAGFGYFSDFNGITANATIAGTVVCTGSILQLQADTLQGVSYSWTGPNGFTNNQQNPIIPNSSIANTGNYYLTVTYPGCGVFKDSIYVDVKQPVRSVVNQTICNGQTYFGHTISGQYIDTYTASNGCDSIRTLNLSVKPSSASYTTATICTGQSYWGHSSEGTYLDTLHSYNGCDSIRTLVLTIHPAYSFSMTQHICQGQVYEGYYQTGTYLDTFRTINGCDSVRILNLQVQNRANFDTTITICGGESLWGHASTGTYTDTLNTWYGCDSFRTLHLTVADNCPKLFPSAFSPNHDGKNDLFHISNAFLLDHFHLMIYNRWGQKLFDTTDETAGWDGYYNGQLQSAGTYVWYCEYQEAGILKQLKGTVVLVY